MKKRHKNKETSIDNLAVMVQNGFREISLDINELRQDLNNTRRDLNSLREEMNHRFDIVENKLIARHDREIEQLRDKVLKHEVSIAKLQSR